MIQELNFLHLGLLGRFIRSGVDSVEKYALLNIAKGELSRVGVHRNIDEVLSLTSGINEQSSYDQIYAAMRRGYEKYKAEHS